MLTCSTRSISPWEPRRTARLRRWNTPLRLNVRCVRNFVLMWTTADWFVKIRSTWNGRWWSGERKPIPSMNWLIISICQGWPEFSQWLDAVIQRVEMYNASLPVPLSPPECRAIGKSIAKYTHRNFTPETFAQYVADTHTLTYVFVPLALTPR